jgi:hypothetical protein
VHLETAPKTPREFADALASPLAQRLFSNRGVIVLYRKADKNKINRKKQERAKAQGKSLPKAGKD